MSEHDRERESERAETGEATFTVRTAREGDTERMAAAHAAATVALGRSAYDPEQVRAWARGRYDYGVDEDCERLVVAVRERSTDPENGPAADYDEVLGFGALRYEAGDYLDGVAGEVQAVYVHPAFARQGVGAALYADLERAARERDVGSLGLWASLNAVGFYERQGFERVAEHDHEFGDGVAATVVEMHKRL